jgi:hypothetical protein
VSTSYAASLVDHLGVSSIRLTAAERVRIVIAVESTFLELANLYEGLLPLFSRYNFKPQSAGFVSRGLSEQIESPTSTSAFRADKAFRNHLCSRTSLPSSEVPGRFRLRTLTGVARQRFDARVLELEKISSTLPLHDRDSSNSIHNRPPLRDRDRSARDDCISFISDICARRGTKPLGATSRTVPPYA